MNSWKQYSLSDFAIINPKVKLIIDNEYPFLAMESVEPGKRFVDILPYEKYSGNGTKFEAGDTVFARITPCLENGKIAQFNIQNGKAGFGSTEFFIFRGKSGISDSGFLYYLLQTYEIRKHAENSMAGASGRQRADLNYLKKIIISAPLIEQQKKIASTLSVFDKLIEKNNKRIKIFEEMLQLLYREWFVEFRFLGHEKAKYIDFEERKIPDGWVISNLDEIATKTQIKYKDKNCNLPLLDLARIKSHSQIISDLGNPIELSTSRIIFKKENILFGAVRPYFHKVIFAPFDGVTNTSILVLKPKKEFQLPYLFNILNSYESIEWATTFSSGTKMPTINWGVLKKMPIIIPDEITLKNFEKIAKHQLEFIAIMNEQNYILREVRDLLLPKLISGEVNTSNLNIGIKDN